MLYLHITTVSLYNCLTSLSVYLKLFTLAIVR